MIGLKMYNVASGMEKFVIPDLPDLPSGLIIQADADCLALLECKRNLHWLVRI